MILTWRDVWPPEADGTGHWTGDECPCVPWCFLDGEGEVVVAHRYFTEQIIHTSAEVDVEELV